MLTSGNGGDETDETEGEVIWGRQDEEVRKGGDERRGREIP